MLLALLQDVSLWVFNNKVMLTWMCCSIQATLNTINLPNAYTKYYSVVSNNMADFQDGAIATVTTYSYAVIDKKDIGTGNCKIINVTP